MTKIKPALTRKEAKANIRYWIAVIIAFSFLAGVLTSAVVIDFPRRQDWYALLFPGVLPVLIIPAAIKFIFDEIFYLEIKAGWTEGKQ